MLTCRAADFSHLLSILILLQKMKSSSVCIREWMELSITDGVVERIGHFVQIAIPLPNRLRLPLP
jgi:hypothetical protein